ncbi:MAG: glycosyltransferase N-terminal domain-containing protein [Hyphomicrobium sp.]
MVARHGDAELVGTAMERFGVELIRGAGAGGRRKDRGGVHALRQAVRSLKDGYSVVMTADVPPGPARKAGIGIVTIARLSGRPIVPCAAASSRFRLPRHLEPPDNQPARLQDRLCSGRSDLGAGRRRRGRTRVRPPAVGAGDERRDRQGLRDRRRRLEARDAAEPHRPQRAAPRARLPPQGLSHQHELAASLGAAHSQGAGAQRQRGSAPARRAAGARERPPRPNGVLCWVHAASVGETNAVLPVIEALGSARPDLNFLLTTGTVTSAGVAERRLGPNAVHQYVPLDAPQYAARFLEHWRPDLAVFTESEIWPSLLLETSARDIPIALVNARLSHRSRRTLAAEQGDGRAAVQPLQHRPRPE